MRKDKVKIQLFYYDLWKYLTVNCISLVYYLTNASISGYGVVGVFYMDKQSMNCFKSMQRYVFNVPVLQCPCSQRAPLWPLPAQKVGPQVISQTLFLEVEHSYSFQTQDVKIHFFSRETDFLILHRPTDPLDKASGHSAYLGFIPEPGVVTTFSKSFPFPWHGNDHDLSALQSTYRPTDISYRYTKLPAGQPGWPCSKFKYLRTLKPQQIINKTAHFCFPKVFREREWPPGGVNQLWLKKLALQP